MQYTDARRNAIHRRQMQRDATQESMSYCEPAFSRLQGLSARAERGQCFEVTPPLSAFNVAIQHPGTSKPSSRLKRPPAIVIWICNASFSSSSLNPLARSITFIPFQSMECWLFHTCSAIVDLTVSPLLQASQCSLTLVSSLRLVSPM